MAIPVFSKNLADTFKILHLNRPESLEKYCTFIAMHVLPSQE